MPIRISGRISILDVLVGFLLLSNFGVTTSIVYAATSSIPQTEISICSSTEPEVVMLVEPAIITGIRTSLSQFESDLCNSGYSVAELSYSFSSPPEIRSYLLSLHNKLQGKLIGTMLVGNIPHAYQWVTLTSLNPLIPSTTEEAISFQYYADLNGVFATSSNFVSTHPNSHQYSYDIHSGTTDWEIWVGILPYYKGNQNSTINAINDYFKKNHLYRSGGYHLPRAFSEIYEFSSASTSLAYSQIVDSIKIGQYAWTPFSNASNSKIYVNNDVNNLTVANGYRDLSLGVADFTVQDAHGFYGASGGLTTAWAESNPIRTMFYWSNGCAVGNLDYSNNFLASTLYSSSSMVLVAKGTTNNSGGMGSNTNGFFGHNIATSLANGKSFGQAILDHVNAPLVYPYSVDREFHFGTAAVLGDPTLGVQPILKNNTTTFDFTISNGGSQKVDRGGVATNTLTLLASGTPRTVSFSTSGLPAGVSISFFPASCSLSCSSILTIITSTSTPLGSYQVSITASTSGSISQVTSFNLYISTPQIIPPPSSTSTKIVIGARIQVASNLIVRRSHYSTSTTIGIEKAGFLGTVISGPVFSNNYSWWQISYDNGLTGWSVENYLIKTTGDITPPIISLPHAFYVSPIYAYIVWGTNEFTDAEINYGSSVNYGLVVTSTIQARIHAFALFDLTPTTTYHYRIKSRDAAGNLANSTDLTFKTLATSSDHIFPRITLYAPTSGVVVHGTSTLVGAAATDNVRVGGVQFRLDGQKLGDEDRVFPFSIYWDTTKISDGTHTLDAIARDSSGNSSTSLLRVIKVDNAAPFISGITSTTTLKSAVVNWQTSESSTGQIEYGQSTAYGSSTLLLGSLVNMHSQIILGLASSTTYHYRIKSKDKVGNLAVSSDFTFTTKGPSDKFALKERVMTTASVYIRSTAAGSILGTKASSSRGAIIGGPIYLGNYWWWQVDYDSGVDGWTAEDYLTTPPPFDFNISTVASTTVIGESSTTINVSSTLLGDASVPVTFSISNLPQAITATFNPVNCNPSCSSKLNIQAAANAPQETSTVMITANGGGIEHSASFLLNVKPRPTLDFALYASSSASVVRGSSVLVIVSAVSVNTPVGSRRIINFSSSGLPPNTTASFGVPGCTPNCGTSFFIRTTTSTPIGSYNMILNGAEQGGATISLPFTLAVKA